MSHTMHMEIDLGRNGTDACVSGAMSATSTNLHFHGLTVPAKCHQDEVLRATAAQSAAVLGIRQCAIRGVNGRIDVTDRTVTQSARHRIVLFTRDVLAHLVEQLERPMQAARAVRGAAHRRMVFDVLAIVDRGMLDLTNRRIDFPDRDIFV